MSTFNPPPLYPHLGVLAGLHRLYLQYEREDAELADARASLPPGERIQAQEEEENKRINQRRDAAVAKALEAACPELTNALRYVAYHRLPLGNTVMETLPEHKQIEVQMLLGEFGE